jgi:hypothetical protein
VAVLMSVTVLDNSCRKMSLMAVGCGAGRFFPTNQGGTENGKRTDHPRPRILAWRLGMG